MLQFYYLIQKSRSAFLRLFLAFGCSVATLGAQTRNQAVEVLNLYVAYGNETIHAMWPMYQELMSFNASLNRRVHYPNAYLSFSNEDYLNNTSNYKVLPATLYQQCLSQSKILAATDQKALNTQLNACKVTLDHIQVHRDSLAAFCKEKRFVHTEKIPWTYTQLNQIEMLFAEYKLHKDSLYQKIQQIYTQKYPATNTSHKIVAMAKLFQPALGYCKSMLDDLNANDTSKIASYTQALDVLIAQYESQKDENLKGLYRFGYSNGLAPYWRYDAVVNELKAISQHGHHFSRSNWTEGSYRDYPKAYYYYNSQVINKYNRYGMGLIQAYNQFVDLADGKQIQKNAGIDDYYIKNKSIALDVSVTKLLHAIEEPHQYKVLHTKEKPVSEPNTNTPQNPAPKEDSVVASLEGYAHNHLVFLLDVSASMNTSEKLPLLKDAFKYLLTLTRLEDQVAVVTYSGEARVEIPSISASKQKKILSKLDKLQSNGGTNAYGGLKLAYETALQHYIPKGNNRIILASDGEFGINASIQAMIEENLKKGVTLSVFLFGQAKNDRVIEQLKHLAQLGKGNFRLIDSDNAHKSLIIEAQAVKK